jgi:hypothetical protein
VDGTVTLPDWATGMVDLHAHASPSLLPRHGTDAETVAAERALGFSTVVLKSHEGSTVDRAVLAGADVYGGIVLNSPVGGANPDAVEVAARLGGRIVWMPTVSSATHQAGAERPELSVHQGFRLRRVDVVTDGALRAEWYDVLDVVAAHDLVLASGHLSAAETVVLFTAARDRGVTRLLVNHPKMPFLGWDSSFAAPLRALGARLELGILPDILSGPAGASIDLVDEYPRDLLVFGADLGHAHHPTPGQAMPDWLRALERRAGEATAHAITSTNGRELLT